MQWIYYTVDSSAILNSFKYFFNTQFFVGFHSFGLFFYYTMILSFCLVTFRLQLFYSLKYLDYTAYSY